MSFTLDELNQKLQLLNMEVAQKISRLVHLTDLKTQLIAEIQLKEHSRKSKSTAHLRVVTNGEAFDSESSESALLVMASPRREDQDTYHRRLDLIRNTVDRRVVIEVSFNEPAKQYVTKVFRGGTLIETWNLPAWKRGKIRCRIEHDKKMKIPWQRIRQGKVWKLQTEIRPFHVDRTWVQQNILKFPQPS